MKIKKVKTKVILSLPQLKKRVQGVVNRYIRKRDEMKPCVSCDNGLVAHAGHYIAQGSGGALRFNEENLNGQCIHCNVWKHGNLLEYRINLAIRIGIKKVNWLEDHRKDMKKWTRTELLEIEEQYKEKLKKL